MVVIFRDSLMFDHILYQTWYNLAVSQFAELRKT